MTLGGSGARWRLQHMSWTGGCKPRPSTRCATATLRLRWALWNDKASAWGQQLRTAGACVLVHQQQQDVI